MLQKVNENIILENRLEKVIICGDPGCDGYNTQGVVVFETILRKEADFKIVVGDMVPVGSKNNYEYFKEIVDISSEDPVYCLAGNHDILNYEQYCGKKDYFIKSDDTLFIILDNSKRYFTDKSIEFLQKTLAEQECKHVFVLFHIPPKNPYILNNILDEEWEKIRVELDKYKEKVVAIICGHVHSVGDYKLDGYRVIITGGAGSAFDSIEKLAAHRNEHHYFSLDRDDENWEITKIDVPYEESKVEYSTKEEIEVLMNLEKAFLGESVAFRKYLLFAEIAEKEGYEGVAKLFRAAAESEYYHAKHMLTAMNGINFTLENLETAIKNEEFEVNDMYLKFSENAKEAKSNRAYNSFQSALEAEKVHHKLFKKALDSVKAGKDISVEKYFTCNRCGYTHKGENPPKYCPGCGTDMFKFSSVK